MSRCIGWEGRFCRKRELILLAVGMREMANVDRYVIADYERSNFSVAQVLFAENSVERIVAIQPPSAGGTGRSGLSRGVLIAVIVVSIVGAAVLSSGIFMLLQLRRKRRTVAIAQIEKEMQDDEEIAKEPQEVHGAETKPEMQGDERDLRHELPAKLFVGRTEMVGSEQDLRHELSALERAVELSAEVVREESRAGEST